MVSHDLDQVRRVADTVTLIDQTVRRTGTPAEVLTGGLAASLTLNGGLTPAMNALYDQLAALATRGVLPGDLPVRVLRARIDLGAAAGAVARRVEPPGGGAAPRVLLRRAAGRRRSPA